MGGDVRSIAAINIAGLEPGLAATGEPEFRTVDPTTLLVDDGYQRNLSERSIHLIRRIITGWDWRRFKPPVVAETPAGLEVIDGQHTAIAAASHPDVPTIPVMVVVAPNQAARAQAFIGHNRDRLGMTPMQIHFAAIAAGDDDALDIAKVCDRAGVTMLKATPGNGVWKPGETVAVKGIGALINRRGVVGARKVLEVLARGGASPISTGAIKAVEMLLHDREYAGEVSGEDITSALIALGSGADAEAKVFAAAHNVSQWKALGVVLFRRARRGRRRTN